MATKKIEKTEKTEQTKQIETVEKAEKTEKPKKKATNAKKIWRPSNMEKDEKDILLRPTEQWTTTPQTTERIISLAKMLSKGMSRKSAQEWIMTNYDVSARQARAYYSAALRYLIPDNEEEYKRGLIQSNIDRLETIIERTMAEGSADYKSAIAAIQEINRLVAPNDNSIEVATKDAAFRIKFGSD